MHVDTSIASSNARASVGSSTGVLPVRALCAGPRTDTAGLAGTTWQRTSQSKRRRTAASRCLTVGAARSSPSCSIHAATWSGWICGSALTPRIAHQPRKSPTARIGAPGVGVADRRGEEFQEAQLRLAVGRGDQRG